MPQVSEGVRSILSLPWAYVFFHYLIGAPKRTSIIVKEHVRPTAGHRVLDIGCGPGTIVPYLPNMEYVGFDASQTYISSARARFGARAIFSCERVSNFSLHRGSYFDIVLAMGIVHHLDDSEALRLFQIAHAALKPGGKLVTLDGCFTEDQSASARYIISKDRGQYVRTREGYLQIGSQVFSDITVTIRDDLLRIPYTHIILECIR